ncbi:MAG: 3'-5' exonuclease [Roseburia sp.]|nr:3'-5' exonuclease [Roseburia sp.]
MLKDYVVIDLEMTGLNAKTDKILEVAAVRVRDGKETEVFSAVTNPQITLSEKITELTGITQKDADEGLPLDDTVQKFLEFLGDDILVGQNVIFDFSFLKQWAVNHKLVLEKQAVDTLKLARLFLPAEQKKDLESLCAYFEIPRVNAHRALDDARETAQIFEKMKVIYGAEHAEAFLPKPLLYKAKKQSPATERQKEYLRRFAKYHGIALEEFSPMMTKSEASRLTDRLIATYGKMEKEKETEENAIS